MNAATDGQPNFAESWQAYAYAMAHALADAGLFTRSEWTHALGERLRARPHDDGAFYFDAFLETLETLVVAKGVAQTGDLAALKEEWRRAYESTRHGRPVALTR